MVQQGQIDNLLRESGEIPAPPHVSAQATLQDYDGIYARSIEDPEGFWAEAAEGLHWFRTLGPGVSVGIPQLPLVCGWADQHLLQRSGRSPGHRAAQQGRPHLAGRGRHRASLYLRPPGPAGQPLRQRAQVPGHRQGRPRRHLHAPYPRGGHHHAGLRPHRRHPQRGLRRVQRRLPARPHPGRLGQGAHHRRRGLPPRQQGGPHRHRQRGRGGLRLPDFGHRLAAGDGPERT